MMGQRCTICRDPIGPDSAIWINPEFADDMAHARCRVASRTAARPGDPPNFVVPLRGGPPEPGEIFLLLGDEFDATRPMALGWHRYRLEAPMVPNNPVHWVVFDDQMREFLTYCGDGSPHAGMRYYAIASEVYEKQGASEATIAHALEEYVGSRSMAERITRLLMPALVRESPRAQ